MLQMITKMAGELGVQPDQAQALMGSVLSMVETQADPDQAAKLNEAVPEMAGWKQQAEQQQEQSSAGGGLGGFLSAAAGALGGQQAKDMATIATLLINFGLETSKAAMVAPMVLDFLDDRLDAELLRGLLSAAPLLATFAKMRDGDDTPDAVQPQAQQGDDGEFGLDDAANLIGGFFGKK